MKNLLLILTFLLTGTFAFANVESSEVVINSDTQSQVQKEHLRISLDGSTDYMLEQLKLLDQNVDLDGFEGCTVSVTVTWRSGRKVTANFSSDDCSSAVAAARLFLSLL